MVMIKIKYKLTTRRNRWTDFGACVDKSNMLCDVIMEWCWVLKGLVRIW